MVLVAATAPYLDAQMVVSLDPSTPAPAQVGALVTWTATVSNTRAGTLWYRFRARRIGHNLRVIKDYGPDPTLDWTASDHEGRFEIEVSVRNRDTGEIAAAVSPYEMLSNVAGDQPVITATSHPLVFLYSAPACSPASRMRVAFQSPDGVTQNTPYQRCRSGLSMNFYLAGMRPETRYVVHQTIDAGAGFVDGPPLSLTTGSLPVDLPAQTLRQAPPAPASNPILLQAALFTHPLATDLNGNVVWYYPNTLSFLTEPEPGGYYLGIVQDGTRDLSRQIIREFDLVGTTVLETNVARVNEQLAAMGKPPVTAFHHEARRLSDGRILTIAGVERILTDVQGPGPVDVLGEMILVMNRNLEVVWTWDAFDHLDPARKAVLDERCTAQSCAPIYLANTATDWIHGNSVDESPDGNLLLSSRSQDWLIKIDYRNGKGAGNVIWRLGKDGDFRFDSADPYPWFSHQHDAGFAPGSNDTLTVFDNGNTRHAQDANAHSRGQVIRLDEPNRVASLLLNVDLGVYSSALGSAQALPDGHYHFGSGFLGTGSSISMELDASGNVVYALEAGAWEYRSYRMRDMYGQR